MKIVFWLLFFLIVYHYFLFPLVVFLLAALSAKPVRKGNRLPTVSLIIAAYNEEKVIEEKIRNCFRLDYPKDRLEIIVVSDGSKDRTPSIVERFAPSGIISLFDPPRNGKTAALNRGIKRATGEIIVFSDANSMYDSKAIKLLARNFEDPTVGGVCGRKMIVANLGRESSRGDNLFWDFESRVKIKQSQIGSIATGDGEIFAIRKELYSEIPAYVINDDTAITFNILQQGYRVVYEPEAISNEEASIELEDDFNVKARMVSGGLQTLAIYRKMLLPPTSFFALQFISHKVLRWAMPILLVLLFLTNCFLRHGFYLYFFQAQCVFYLASGIGYFLRKGNLKVRIFYFPLYYCYMNAAALVGFSYFARRRAGTAIWKKAQR